MRFFIRVDASLKMGTGHVMRCLTLAEELRERGSNVEFIGRELKGNLSAFIECERAFTVHRLAHPGEGQSSDSNDLAHAAWLEADWETDAEQTLKVLTQVQAPDWLIVDHYALDSRWEKLVRPHVQRIMVIDDLADRPHECDLLLDQNFSKLPDRYTSLVPASCSTLLGPKYALVRREFATHRGHLASLGNSVKRILVYFGGVDGSNETTKSLRAIQHSGLRRPIVDVVVGRTNPHKDEIVNVAGKMDLAIVREQVENMAELMVQADLFVGAGGTTTWERCCLGLPSIVIAVAMNQRYLAESMAEEGYLIYLGEGQSVSEQKLVDALSMMNDPVQLRSFAERSKKLVDGRGTERVVDILCQSVVALKERPDDDDK
jgi:UDP-2,4-diacetamido-2,4,6-trideoxy-beta-L-altropyranose hydrolase